MSNDVNSKASRSSTDDRLVSNGIVITMDNQHRVLKNSDVLVVDGVIKEIGRISALLKVPSALTRPAASSCPE